MQNRDKFPAKSQIAKNWCLSTRSRYSILQLNPKQHGSKQNWWRRRELNPRPSRFNEEDYILSLFTSLLTCYQETGLREKASWEAPIDPKGGNQRVSALYDAWPQAGLATQADVAALIMQLEHIPFQDVFFSGRINEVARTLGMPSFMSFDPSKPIAP